MKMSTKVSLFKYLMINISVVMPLVIYLSLAGLFAISGIGGALLLGGIFINLMWMGFLVVHQ